MCIWRPSWNASSWWPAGGKCCAWPRATRCAPPSSAPSPTICARPLAGIKLAVGGLRQDDVRYTPEEEQELLATIEECSDRLDALVGNLLDMSRITSDSVNPLLKPVRWYEVIPGALHGVPGGRVRVELPANMPEVDADPGMLERVIANIVENAVKYAPDSDIVLVGAAGGLSPATLGGRPAGELRIIDHGRGVPAESVLEMFRPFQRLDDAPQATGVGLGPGRGQGLHRGHGRKPDRGRDTGRRPDHGDPAAALHRHPVRRAPRPGPAGAAVGCWRAAVRRCPLASGPDTP